MTDGGDKEVIVIGAGGHAKVVISSLLACGYSVAAILDDDTEKIGKDLMGKAIAGPVDKYLSGSKARAILAVGSNRTRMKLALRYNDVEWASVVHDQAYVHPTAQLGSGTVVFAGAVIQPEVRIGSHVIVNTGATIDHDCVIEDYCHIAPGAHLAGDVTIGQGSLIGVGCGVNPGLTIGSWVTTGAGAAVISNLQDNITAVGIPATRLGPKKR